MRDSRVKHAGRTKGNGAVCLLRINARVILNSGASKDFPLQFEPRDQFEQRQQKLEQSKLWGTIHPREFRWTDSGCSVGENAHPVLRRE